MNHLATAWVENEEDDSDLFKWSEWASKAVKPPAPARQPPAQQEVKVAEQSELLRVLKQILESNNNPSNKPSQSLTRLKLTLPAFSGEKFKCGEWWTECQKTLKRAGVAPEWWADQMLGSGCFPKKETERLFKGLLVNANRHTDMPKIMKKFVDRYDTGLDVHLYGQLGRDKRNGRQSFLDLVAECRSLFGKLEKLPEPFKLVLTAPQQCLFVLCKARSELVQRLRMGFEDPGKWTLDEFASYVTRFGLDSRSNNTNNTSYSQ